MPTRIPQPPEAARIAPRKRPGQQRSRALVAAVVEASARVLVAEGIDRFTTNRVAEAAGVSVGSLYQYFPGKEALLAALVGREQTSRALRLEAAIEQVRGLPLETAVAHLVDQAARRAALPLEQALDRVERILPVDAVLAAARARIDRAVAEFVSSHFPQARAAEAEAAGRTLRALVEAVTDRWVDGQGRARTEAVRAVLGYLARFAQECAPQRLPPGAGSP